MWEGSANKSDRSKTGFAHSFSPKEHANGHARHRPQWAEYDDDGGWPPVHAFELGEKSWKLALGDARRAPSRCTVAAGDIAAVLAAVANARARCHLGADDLVYSCYEAGRDGFWLHRWLTEQGIADLVVDSASIAR
ncbi:hypothetical protein [Burkholderia sp. JP2-270]|uniref:hypothetical protein n=1 Tax=Burkholderia sp. JP2-270 TaxID=2217913 RepID=UPI001EF7D9B3|nr:hypothetical protein [Burkholderia sp. JP2-270]